ncbi:MAG: hypothetical protein HC782_02705 [Gammaproteobacteria bacterium]|nr:hypothetical protein [Gammaproteobacteria bacterium]
MNILLRQLQFWRAALLSMVSMAFLLAPVAFAQYLPTVVTPVVNAVQIGQPFDGVALIGGSPAPSTLTFANVPAGLTATHLGGGRVRLTGMATGAARTATW